MDYWNAEIKREKVVYKKTENIKQERHDDDDDNHDDDK